MHSAEVSAIYVSTDDPEIASIAHAAGAEVIERPTELSDDGATSESALLHVLDTRRARGLDDPDLVVFLQCTSPVRAATDIDGAIEALLTEEADSLFSATENRLLVWGLDQDRLVSINYDSTARRREQDMDRQWQENGSIYVFRPRILRELGNRLGGKIAVYPMDYWSSFQLDSPDDALLLDWIMSGLRPAEVAWPERLDLVVFDFDGVMTDNKVSVDGEGDERVTVHRGDGLGVSQLRDAGYSMLVVSTEEHGVVAARCAKLGLECHHGVSDKAALLRLLLAERAIDPVHVAFVGNDVNDLACLELVGLPVVVADAHPTVRAAAGLVLTRSGGEGAVREFCDRTISRYGSWKIQG